jgi:hypothetical protein
VHVYVTGPFTKAEKALAVEPIRCKVSNVRNLWHYITTYNKPLLQHVSSDLDETAMALLEESLVRFSVEEDDSVHHTAEHGGGDASSEPVTDSSTVTFIGTNLLVADDEPSNNDDLVDVNDESAVDDEAYGDEADPCESDAGGDGCEECGTQDCGEEGCGEEECGEEEEQHVSDDDDMSEEVANLEAIAHRVRPKHIPLLVWQWIAVDSIHSKINLCFLKKLLHPHLMSHPHLMIVTSAHSIHPHPYLIPHLHLTPPCKINPMHTFWDVCLCRPTTTCPPTPKTPFRFLAHRSSQE